MSEELKSCPFCGGVAKTYDRSYTEGVFYVSCASSACGAEVCDTTLPRVVGVWNTRRSEPPRRKAEQRVIEAAKQKYRSIIYTSGVSQEFADKELVEAVAALLGDSKPLSECNRAVDPGNHEDCTACLAAPPSVEKAMPAPWKCACGWRGLSSQLLSVMREALAHVEAGGANEHLTKASILLSDAVMGIKPKPVEPPRREAEQELDYWRRLAVRREKDNAALAKDFREAMLDLADDWDCDNDGHRYNTGCRKCKAKVMIEKWVMRVTPLAAPSDAKAQEK